MFVAQSAQPSQFDEKNLATLVEFYLARSHFHDYGPEVVQITQSAERGEGFDAAVTTLVPFYCQFKVASFYPPGCDSRFAEHRSAVGFTDSAGFYSMSLHRHHKTKLCEQQNNLFKLSQRYRVAYVAPKFYRDTVIERLKREYREFGYPWRWRDYEVVESGGTKAHFRNIRTFHGLISIPPHRSVPGKDAHRYTFNRQHEVCFHSDPEPLQEGQAQSFSTFLGSIADIMPEVARSPDLVARQQAELLPKLFDVSERSPVLGVVVEDAVRAVVDPDFERREGGMAALRHLDSMAAIRVFGHILRANFGIHQYLMVQMADWSGFDTE